MATSSVPRQDKGVLGKAWEVQGRLESRMDNLGKGKYGRVLRMARKPNAEQWARVAKITSLAMLVIGALGFVVYYIIDQAIPGFIDFLRGT